MNDFVRVASVSPKVSVADPFYNVEEMLKWAKEAEKQSVSLLVYPELAVSGYTAHDLLLQESLQKACAEAVGMFAEKTADSRFCLFLVIPLFYAESCIIPRL